MEMLDAMIDKTMHIHLKDISRETLEKHKGETAIPAGATIGEGVVPIKKIIDRLKKSGFDGELSVECGGIERLRKSIAYIRSII